MAVGGSRCLSDLPDELLRHILFFASAREGATTAVLSRRWRWLWSMSGAVNLDSRSFRHPRSSDAPFLRGAEKALSAAQDPIRRLTLFVPEGSEINWRPSRRRRREDGSASDSDRSLIKSLLSNPAARRVEELRIEVENVLHTAGKLCLDSLPSEALQVLRIVNCSPWMAAPTRPPLPGAAAARFTRLADLHLHGCDVSIEDLGNTIAAAPQLSTLHLQSSYFYSKPPRDDHKDVSPQFDIEIYSVWCPILCPAVTALVLADCTFGFACHRYGGKARLAIELDVPRLQYFRYEGRIVQLTCRLQLKEYVSNDMIRQVDLRLTNGRNDHFHHPGRRICELFWRFVQSFTTTRRLKLKLDLLMDDEFVLADRAIKDGLLGSLSFCRLEELQLEGQYEPGTTSMALLADLLCCCPVVRDLRLKLSKVELPLAPMRSSLNKDEADDGGDLEMQDHLNPSVRRWEVGEQHAKDIQLQHDDNYQIYGIPGLTSEHAFSCLQSHLKRVSLDFHMDAPTCLGVKLAKFFAENAMVLQEIQVEDSGQEMLEHLDPSVRRLVVANIRRSPTKKGAMPRL